jgi:hypothetical protein
MIILLKVSKIAHTKRAQIVAPFGLLLKIPKRQNFAQCGHSAVDTLLLKLHCQ